MPRLIRRTFTPSYSADTREEYEAAVRAGPKMKTEPPKRLESGFRHIQVRGGRKHLGRDDAPPEISVESSARLARQTPGWDRRTQSTRTPRTASTAEANLAATIARAIETYTRASPQARFGFLVPDTAGELIAAGFPPRPARILVARARGKLFTWGDPGERPKMTLQQHVYSALRSSLVVRFSGVARSVEFERRGVLRGVGFRRADGKTKMIVSEEDLVGREYDTWSKSVKQREGDYSSADDDKWFATLWRKAQARIDAFREGQAGTVLLRMTRTTPAGIQKFEESVAWPPERSTPSAAARLPSRRRSLQDVGIEQLPRVLARLSRRKPRHTNIALENTMGRYDELFWLEQYDAGPYGGSSSLPTARRNMAGRHVMHGMARGAEGDPDMVGKTKAQLESMIAKGGAGAKKAKAEISRRQANRALHGKEPKPASRATKRSRAAAAKKHRAANKAAQAPAPSPARAKGGKKSGGQKAAQAQAAKAMAMWRSGQVGSLQEAWDVLKSGRKGRGKSARANAWMPDFTHTREALVPMRMNPGLDSAGALWLDYWDPNYEQAVGQFGVSEKWTSGIQPMSRRNGRKRK